MTLNLYQEWFCGLCGKGHKSGTICPRELEKLSTAQTQAAIPELDANNLLTALEFIQEFDTEKIPNDIHVGPYAYMILKMLPDHRTLKEQRENPPNMFCGIPVYKDYLLEPDIMEVRNKAGKVLQKVRLYK